MRTVIGVAFALLIALQRCQLTWKWPLVRWVARWRMWWSASRKISFMELGASSKLSGASSAPSFEPILDRPLMTSGRTIRPSTRRMRPCRGQRDGGQSFRRWQDFAITGYQTSRPGMFSRSGAPTGTSWFT